MSCDLEIMPENLENLALGQKNLVATLLTVFKIILLWEKVALRI